MRGWAWAQAVTYHVTSTCRSDVAQADDIAHVYKHKNHVRVAYKEEEDKQEPKLWRAQDADNRGCLA